MDWAEVKRLFHEAVRDRSVLEGAPGDLRAEVEALLGAHAAAPPEPPHEGPGSVIGHYKLLQRIGEGGFGVVYMAEQAAPVRRKVALKILRAGMDTAQVVARFEAERQALALMDHASIAKVLDAGATAGGRPYFAMELVKGVPITQYCDEAQVDTRGRLELFVEVCSAVQHAHQKGIIHRDLKPSNVLVTLHDGKPVPKVIDFGIAKALGRRLTERTLFTEFRQMVGTPDYMAPEQAELSGLDVDTRADVYSLGVLLYELLTGTRPFDLGRKGYEEIVRTIRETEPQKPSTRVSTLGEALRAVAQKRQAPPAILGRMLRGDLDWIVLKALEKDRSRRYETANGFALDVQRYLADEPVLATPPSAAYRLRKYVRRHRVGVSAAAVVLAALVASGVAAFAGMREAKIETDEAKSALAAAMERRDEARRARVREAEQRARADAGAAAAATEAARADTVLDLVNEMVSAADPHEQKGRNYRVRQLLDDFDRGLGDRLRAQPDVEAAMRLTMAEAYLGLGLPERAEPHVGTAVAIRRTGGRGDDGPFADALGIRARVEHDSGQFEACAATLREAVAIRRREKDDAALADDLDDLADALRHLRRFDEAGQLAREAVALRRAGGGDLPESLDNLASILREKGDLDAAEALLEEAIALQTAKGGPGLAACISHRADIRCARGDLDGAERLEREALATLKPCVEADHPALAHVALDLASVLLAKGDVAGAERCLAECAPAGDQQRRARPDHVVRLVLLGRAALRKSDPGNAEAHFREALVVARALPEGAERAAALAGLAEVLFARGDAAGAEKNLRDALAILGRTVPDDHPDVGETLAALAQVLFLSGDRAGVKALSLEWVARNRHHLILAFAGTFLMEEGRCADAEPLLRECHANRERLAPGDWTRYNAMSLLGASLAGQGKYAEAEPLLLEAYERMSPPRVFRARKGDARDRIVSLYEAWGKLDKAAEWRRRAD